MDGDARHNRSGWRATIQTERATLDNAALAQIPADLRPLLAQDYAAFSPAETARRRQAIAHAMEEAGASHLLVYGANRTGTAIHWLSGWPITAEAALVHSPGEPDGLWVQYANHVSLASRMAGTAKVAWGGPVNNSDATLRSAMHELERRGAGRDCVAIIGPLGWAQHAMLAERFGRVINLGPAYNRLRLIKSAEELDWLRLGAAFCDSAIAALQAQLRPGLTEHQLGHIVESAFSPLGGNAGIHYFGVSSMAEPGSFVPAQFTSSRQVRAGDAVVTEISADFWSYSGQVLRSFAVAAPPSPLYARLHEAASAAFEAILAVLRPGCTPQQIVDAAGVIEASGFTTCDDLVHGYGGGYLQPVLGSRSRPNGPLPDMVLAENMCLVVQPNVITPDHKAGVQTGELVVITADGARSLHTSPRGFLRV
jgi:Xaa-Pro dipeptidase